VTNVADGGDEKIAFKDKISVFQIGATIVLAIVGFALTGLQVYGTERRSKAERQDKQFESFLTLSQQCSSDDASDRARIRRVLFEYNQNPKLERNQMLEEVMGACSKLITERDAGPLVASAKPTPPPARPPEPSTIPPTGQTPAASPETWVYLGTYRNRKWETRYLDFSENLAPKALNGEHRVRYETGALNVRTGPFSPTTGAFPPVTSSLAPGKRIRILRTWPWYNSDNWWAQIETP
jgi:hypothetical protein